MRRDVAWDRIVSPESLPFLITRQIFAGAGKMGIEAESAAESARHLSNIAARRFLQRARQHRYHESAAARQHARRTARRREPLSPFSRHPRRFEHERMGDGDEDRDDCARARFDRTRPQRRRSKSPNRLTRHKSISRDQTYDWIIELKDGRKISAIDVQRIYLKAAPKSARQTPDEDRHGFCANGKRVLNDLERDVTADARSCRLGGEESSCSRLAGGRKTFLERSLAAIDRSRISQCRFGTGACIYELVRQGSMRRFVNRGRDQDRRSSIRPIRPARFSAAGPWRGSTKRLPRSNGTRLFSAREAARTALVCPRLRSTRASKRSITPRATAEILASSCVRFLNCSGPARRGASARRQSALATTDREKGYDQVIKRSSCVCIRCGWIGTTRTLNP